MNRYDAFDFDARPIASGNRLMDVQGPGERIIADWKALRFAIQGFYPTERPHWTKNGATISAAIRNHRAIVKGGK